MLGAVEHVTGGLVDRQRPRAGFTIRHLPGVDRQSFGLELVTAMVRLAGAFSCS